MTVSNRRAERFAGALLAIAVQALFIALLVFSRSVTAPPEQLVRELTLILPRLPRLLTPPPASAPVPREIPAPSVPVAPVIVTPPLPLAPSAPSPLDLHALGQSIWGCAPEKWSSLTPEQRSHCTRPGEGMA